MRLGCLLLIGVLLVGCATSRALFVHEAQIEVLAADLTPLPDTRVHLNGVTKRTDKHGIATFRVPDCHVSVVVYRDDYRTQAWTVQYRCTPVTLSLKTHQTVMLERL